MENRSNHKMLFFHAYRISKFQSFLLMENRSNRRMGFCIVIIESVSILLINGKPLKSKWEDAIEYIIACVSILLINGKPLKFCVSFAFTNKSSQFQSFLLMENRSNFWKFIRLLVLFTSFNPSY